MSTPDWWANAKKLWVEDDAMTHDRELIDKAWERIFGAPRKMEGVPKERFDAGDADFILYESGRIACFSYPGGDEIRLYDAEVRAEVVEHSAPKIYCNCVGCNLKAEISKGALIPPGWVAFQAIYWPAGTPDVGPLYLRMCGRCVGNMVRGPREGKRST
jgi:hypothetical protein